MSQSRIFCLRPSLVTTASLGPTKSAATGTSQCTEARLRHTHRCRKLSPRSASHRSWPCSSRSAADQNLSATLSLKSGWSGGWRQLLGERSASRAATRRRDNIRVSGGASAPEGSDDLWQRTWVTNFFLKGPITATWRGDPDLRAVPVVKLEADTTETDEVVHSVLAAFHEDTEPGFFHTYEDPLPTKMVDPLPGARAALTSTREIPPQCMLKANYHITDCYSELPAVDRRQFLMVLAAVFGEAKVAAAMAAEAAQEKRAAPKDVSVFRAFGISEDDIYYPKIFEGYWDVDSVLVNVEMPQGMEKLSYSELENIQRTIDQHEKFVARYFNHKGHIIADRLYITMSMLPDPSKFRGIWDPDKAGRLRIVLNNSNYGMESLVTRRSYNDSEPGVFDASEYMREVVDNRKSVDGPPDIKASQVSLRFKWDPWQANVTDVKEIKVIQKVATFDLSDGQDGKGGVDVESLLKVLSRTPRPTVIRKYVMRMKRRTEPSP